SPTRTTSFQPRAPTRAACCTPSRRRNPAPPGTAAVRPLHILAFCIIWLASAPAYARTTVIDDSGTLPYNAAVAMRWQQAQPRGPAGSQMIGTLQLRVRLNVTPWLRRTGRIYLVLPAQQPGAMTAAWTTQGR